MITLVIVVLAIGLAGFTYLGLERLGFRAWLPMGFRAVAWAALGLLLVNVSCPVRGPVRRPLVLLDASLSLGAAGGHWREARDSALRWGDVRGFGDERTLPDTVPSRGRSLLAPALLAASATDRPTLVVSDGEIEDVPDIPPDILARSEVRLFPRAARPDIAITGVSGPARASAGDSIPLDVTVQLLGERARDNIRLEVSSGAKRVASRTVRLRGTSARTRLVVPASALSPGDHLLRVSLADHSDAEPRTDTRLHLITIARTPGVVFLAAPADWDSRFLYRTLRNVAQLPLRGYVRIEPNRWRSMETLGPVSLEQVRRSARQADLLILKGGVTAFGEGSTARGIWNWPSGEEGGTPIPGDWYLSAAETSPLSGAFLGQPMDSFPPAVQLVPTDPGPQDWVALYAQLARRGPQRPAVLGRREGRVRRVTVAVDGLWRWAFRGGPSEQSYRSWVASTTSWLLGASDSARGLVRPVQAVVPNGRPVLFEWAGSGSPSPQAVTWSAVPPIAKGTPPLDGPDTLHFDGNGRATVWLTPGEHRYRLATGGSGTVAVEEYSDELLPRLVTLTAHPGRRAPPTTRSSARDWLWLFGLCVLALSGEWLARRRLGLR
jgi:hypothetical protein